MKSYLQGMITGGVMVFAMFIFMGADKDGEVGRYAISTIATSDEISGNVVAETIIDTKTGYIINRTKRKVDRFQYRTKN